MGHYDFIGVGAGVFNLSLAALIENKSVGKYIFLDKKPAFAWHDNPALEFANMQTTAIKDIVTPAEPTNPFSFLNYLFDRGILEQFYNRADYIVSRAQFNDYLQWVSRGVTSLRFNNEVKNITYDKDRFVIESNEQTYTSKDLVIAAGLIPNVIDIAKPYISNSLYHSSQYSKFCKESYDGKKVAVIGGGTSGAEIFYDIINKSHPEEVIWVSERSRFAQLEESGLTDEFFSSSFVTKFHSLPESARQRMNNELLYAGDGITPSLSDAIYKSLFDLKYFGDNKTQYTIRCNSSVVEVSKNGDKYVLSTRCLLLDTTDIYEVDEVIMATGYRTSGFELLSNLFDEFPEIQDKKLNLDYSLEWSKTGQNNIYIQNAGRHSHGAPDPYLSLAAWRASVIANALSGEELFRIRHAEPIVNL